LQASTCLCHGSLRLLRQSVGNRTGNTSRGWFVAGPRL
jgi:hypothetical protein